MGKFTRAQAKAADAKLESTPGTTASENKPQGFWEWLSSLFSGGPSKAEVRATNRERRWMGRAEKERAKQEGKTARVMARKDQKRWKKSSKRFSGKKRKQYFQEQYTGQGQYFKGNPSDGDE